MGLTVILKDETGAHVGTWAAPAHLPRPGDEVQLHPDDQQPRNLSPELNDQPDSDERPLYEVVRATHKIWIDPKRRAEPMFDEAYRDDTVVLHLRRRVDRHPAVRVIE
jgi:hypothetical protein